MTTDHAATDDTTGATMSDNVTVTHTFTVPGMTCGHCEASVKHEVGSIGGVSAVEVDLQTKLVTVSGSALDRDAIVAAIDEAGFDVS
jgi:copper chaperone